jgi:hypothetical protein
VRPTQKLTSLWPSWVVPLPRGVTGGEVGMKGGPEGWAQGPKGLLGPA